MTTNCSSCNCHPCVCGVTVTPQTPIVVHVTPEQGGARGLQGVQGPLGLQGPQGLQGTSGVAGNLFYHYHQATSSSSWTIIHNLGYNPNVTVQDSAGTIVEGEITYTNTNQLTVTFSAAFSGDAYLS